MTYSYNLLAVAQEEYEFSIKWYLERSPMAAENFIKSVDEALKLICDHPNRWRNSYRNFYELNVKKYPYSIVYFIDSQNQLVTVVSICHHKRNPGKKYTK